MNEILHEVEVDFNNGIDGLITDFVSEAIGKIDHERIINRVIRVLDYHKHKAEKLKEFHKKLDKEAK